MRILDHVIERISRNCYTARIAVLKVYSLLLDAIQLFIHIIEVRLEVIADLLCTVFLIEDFSEKIHIIEEIRCIVSLAYNNFDSKRFQLIDRCLIIIALRGNKQLAAHIYNRLIIHLIVIIRNCFILSKYSSPCFRIIRNERIYAGNRINCAQNIDALHIVGIADCYLRQIHRNLYFTVKVILNDMRLSGICRLVASVAASVLSSA